MPPFPSVMEVNWLIAIIVLVIVCVVFVMFRKTRQRWQGDPYFVQTAGLDALEALTSKDKLYLTIGANKQLLLQIYEFHISGSSATIKFLSGNGGQMVDDGEYSYKTENNGFILFDDSKIYLHLVKRNGYNIE